MARTAHLAGGGRRLTQRVDARRHKRLVGRCCASQAGHDSQDHWQHCVRLQPGCGRRCHCCGRGRPGRCCCCLWCCGCMPGPHKLSENCWWQGHRAQQAVPKEDVACGSRWPQSQIDVHHASVSSSSTVAHDDDAATPFTPHSPTSTACNEPAPDAACCSTPAMTPSPTSGSTTQGGVQHGSLSRTLLGSSPAPFLSGACILGPQTQKQVPALTNAQPHALHALHKAGAAHRHAAAAPAAPLHRRARPALALRSVRPGIQHSVGCCIAGLPSRAAEGRQRGKQVHGRQWRMERLLQKVLRAVNLACGAARGTKVST